MCLLTLSLRCTLRETRLEILQTCNVFDLFIIVEEAKKEESEESDDDMGFGEYSLFVYLLH